MEEGKGGGSGRPGLDGLDGLEAFDKLCYPICVLLVITHPGYMDHCGLESPKCIRLDEVPRPGGFPGRQIDQNRLTVE
jgi:hypothetical protein